MQRRPYLALLVSGSASAFGGCLGDVLPSSDSSPTIEAGLQRRILLVGQDTVPDEFQIAITVELLNATITDSHTARLRITTTNHGSKRALSVSTDGCAILNRSSQASTPPGMWLEHEKASASRVQAGNGWIAEDLPESPNGFGGYGCPKNEFQSGESVENTYDVWHDGRVDGYMKPGEYRWEVDVNIWADSSANETPSRTFNWGFSLGVENPE